MHFQFLFPLFFCIINIMKKVIIKLINLYQITPLHMHSMCRFTPTCSEYTKISVERFGLIKGLFLGFKRILRCRPFGKFGIDNVPEKDGK